MGRVNDGTSFDVIIVGARVAGSAAAILLGRQGRRVLVLDRAAFPSDIISTHIVLGGGATVLERMGAFDELARLGGHAFTRMRQHTPGVEFTGTIRNGDGSIARGICLGRALMDAAMLDLARQSGAVTVRERFRVTDVLIADGAVVGVRGEDPAGVRDFFAPLTIGADGMRSTVADLVSRKLPGAFARADIPCARAYYYAYYRGARLDEIDGTVFVEFDAEAGSFHIACRCENGLVVAGAGFDPVALDQFKRELPASYHAKVASSAFCARMLAGASLASRIYAVPKLYNTLRDPACNGALLLGDAGLHVDPILGQGHSFALISAELMASLATGWFAKARAGFIDAGTLSEFTRLRDSRLSVHYNAALATSQRLAPDPTAAQLALAVRHQPWAADEMASFANMLLGNGEFPSPLLQQLMADALAARA